jgi:hypothetical protein
MDDSGDELYEAAISAASILANKWLMLYIFFKIVIFVYMLIFIKAAYQ